MRSQLPAVVVFVDRFPVLSETFVINEVAALARLGHAVSVEARERPRGPAGVVPDGVSVHYLKDESRMERLRALAWLVARHPLWVAADTRRRLRPGASARATPTRRLAVRVRRLDGLGDRLHIHSHFAKAASDDAYRIARLLDVRTSVTAHAWDIYISPTDLRERLVRSDFVTSGCDYTVADLREVTGPEHADRIFKQVMGVDHRTFERSAPLPGTRHVVAVGRLVEKKGFIHLVRAASRLPDVRVTIVGEGPDRDVLAAEIERLGIGDRVSLPGARSSSEVRALLDGEADLLCMPCVVAENGDRDSMPVVVKEAMAMELCIVASDEVGLPEIVRPPWGELVPPGDDEALAAAIDRMLSLDPVARAEAGAAGRRHVISYADVDEETRRLSEWIARANAQPTATSDLVRPSTRSRSSSDAGK